VCGVVENFHFEIAVMELLEDVDMAVRNILLDARRCGVEGSEGIGGESTECNTLNRQKGLSRR
jgi:hypothetical protein